MGRGRRGRSKEGGLSFVEAHNKCDTLGKEPASCFSSSCF